MVVELLAEGFEEIEAITPVDFLRRAGADVRLIGVTGSTVRGAHGIAVETEMPLDRLAADMEIHAVILPGGAQGADNLAASKPALELITRLYDMNRLVAAICASPAVVLQKTGILRGRRVTCYPGFEDRLEGCTFVEDRVVVDGNLITSRGPGTAAEFSLALIEALVGPEQAREIQLGTLTALGPPSGRQGPPSGRQGPSFGRQG